MRGPIAAVRSAAGAVVKHLPHSEPLPDPPRAWGDAVLKGPLSVDVERWRRFEGEMSRSDVVDGTRYTLTLRRGRSCERGSDGVWWRGDPADIVPELTGWLRVGPEAGGGEEFVYEARLDLARWRGGKNAADLVITAGNWRTHTETVHREAPWPVREGVPSAATTSRTPSTDTFGWTGFPTEPARLREDVGLPTIERGEAGLRALADAIALPPDTAKTGFRALDQVRFEHDLPEELLFLAWKPAGSHLSDADERYVVRVAAEGPFGYATPKYLDDERHFNAASTLDLGYVVKRVDVHDDRVTLSGTGWLLHLVGRELDVRVEPLP